jgi:hypothetical protein
MFCFSLVLKAVKGLVEQRDLYCDSQRRIKEMEDEIDVLKEQVAQLELKAR